ncbi:hypothetical protein D3C84_673550 [compost metagenome]
MLKPTFLFGFLISPAIKVTPVQESLENKVPTIAADIPEIKAVVLIGIHEPVSVLKECGVQASVQLAFQIEALAARVNPKMISPEMDTIFIMVKMVCRILLFFTPRVFK